MTISELKQEIYDLGAIHTPKVAGITEGAMRSIANRAVRHICTEYSVPRFCYRGPLQPQRTVYKLDFMVSALTRVVVHYNQKDYPLTKVHADAISVPYSRYNPSTLTPAATYAAESEAVDPSAIRFYGSEVRAPSSENTEGAFLLWIRPAPNVYVTDGLWVWGKKSLEGLSESQNIPLPEVYTEAAVYWGLWLATHESKWLATYEETVAKSVNYAPEEGALPMPERAY